jgi:hypothetical protein
MPKLENDGASLDFIVRDDNQTLIEITGGNAFHFPVRTGVPPVTYKSINSSGSVVYYKDHISGLTPIEDPIQVNLYIRQLKRITELNNRNKMRKVGYA